MHACLSREQDVLKYNNGYRKRRCYYYCCYCCLVGCVSTSRDHTSAYWPCNRQSRGSELRWRIFIVSGTESSVGARVGLRGSVVSPNERCFGVTCFDGQCGLWVIPHGRHTPSRCSLPSRRRHREIVLCCKRFVLRKVQKVPGAQFIFVDKSHFSYRTYDEYWTRL